MRRILSKLSDAKMLGGIGSILLFIPAVSIIGYILILIATKYVADELADSSIFNDMIYAVVAAIVGVAVGAGFLFSGVFFGVFTSGLSVGLGFVGLLVAVWVFLVISSIFIRRAYDKMATRLNVGSFRTAGTLYFVGALLTIVLVGFLILFIAYIFQIIAFFSIPESPPSASGQPMPTAAPSAPAGAKFCSYCGTQVAPNAVFCPKCGAKQTT